MAQKTTLEFLKTEAGSGAVLGLAALAALIVANSPWSAAYFGWLKSEHVVQIGPLFLEMSISEWIKEGLMAVFFLVVGLEIKYEIPSLRTRRMVAGKSAAATASPYSSPRSKKRGSGR